MDTKPRKTKDIADQAPQGGRTRGPEAALEKEEKEGYEDSEPSEAVANKDDARWSIDAAVSDPDVEDTKGGE
jgi:hypothetical protein